MSVREVRRHEVLVRGQQRRDGAVDEHHVVPLRATDGVHEGRFCSLAQQT